MRAIFACAGILCALTFAFAAARCGLGATTSSASNGIQSALQIGSPTDQPSAGTAAPQVTAEAPPQVPAQEAAPPPAPVGEPPAAELPQPAPSAEPAPAESAPEPPKSVLADNQVIVYYGTPLASGLGVLGYYDRPEQAADAVAERARRYDELNGDRGAVGALDLIYSLVQAEPTENGLYLSDLPDDVVGRYVEVTRERNMPLFLDVQIGRANVIDEVRRLEGYLLNPNVHIAIDPEYAVGPWGVPLQTPGRISGEQINDIQQYLRDLVTQHGLPPKMMVVHQYMEDTVVDSQRIETYDGVDFVLNMDGLGDAAEKQRKYEFFSAQHHSKNEAFNIFLQHDDRVMSEEEILGLSPAPQLVFYQ
jgi:hypothetical protein